MDSQKKESFEGWCILELMGHRRLAGYLREQEIAGAAFLRIDVPGPEGPQATQFYSATAVYCITPTTEDLARALAQRDKPEPVHRWELPRAPKAAEQRQSSTSFGQFGDGGGDDPSDGSAWSEDDEDDNPGPDDDELAEIRRAHPDRVGSE